jgi:predicted  nucleic acid-binding Zn-ribbon protein
VERVFQLEHELEATRRRLIQLERRAERARAELERQVEELRRGRAELVRYEPRGSELVPVGRSRAGSLSVRVERRTNP